jgi:hypothetical protein
MNKDFLEYIFIIYLAMLFHTITVDYFTRGGRIGLLQGISLAFYGVQVPYDNKPVEFYSPWQCPSGGNEYEYIHQQPDPYRSHEENPAIMPSYQRQFQYEEPSMYERNYPKIVTRRPEYHPNERGNPLVSAAFAETQDLKPTNSPHIYPQDGSQALMDSNFASFVP